MVSPLALHWNYAINNQTATFIPQDTTQKTYKWYFGTGDSSLLKKPVYTYKSNGKYLIELIETNADGCYSSNFDSISLGVLGMQSVPGSATDLHLSIFPNPFENKTKITYTLLRKSKVNVSVYDIEGKLVAQIKDGYYGEGKYQDEFDATQYNAVAGIYLLKIIVNGEVYTSRFAEMK